MVYLNVAIGVRDLPKCEAEFEILLSHLSYCRETLENLTIRITLPTGFSHTKPLSTLAGLYRLGESLCRFTALRTLAFETGDIFIRSLVRRFSALELKQFSSWKEICPALDSISLFGAVISVI
ncbi:hypothetical protein FRC08_007389 [Ceratobasidium sp. 394]|nr:hypothetical protein FRC08_007389 [Ceratobasidium sp. 394]